MKKFFNFALMAALTVGLSLGVTSCKDDDDDKLTDEQKAEQQAEKSNKFWNVVSSLTDQYDADYADKTYTPTIGVQDPTDATTRIVYTNDVATAAQRFNYITGATIDENTTTYEWRDDEVGTLTYTRTNDGASYARVDVSIKQMPSLKHIVYKAPTQGENGSFNGTAYYRFGDVVSRQVDGQTEYWVCIRPAFGPEGKGESHWACLNALPNENVYHYHSNTNGNDYYLPTKLGTNKEQMQNLAEMMYAIYMPKSWQENISYYSEDGFFGPKGLRLFHDFHEANLIYHTQYFWQRVKEGWQVNDIYQKVFNATESQVNSQVPVGIHLLYNGYSWWTISSWTCQLWEATFTNGSEKTELNLHKAYYDDKLKKDMKSLTFDCRAMGSKTENYKQYFGNDNNLRWCFRTKTGEQLSSTGKTDVYEPLAGVTEVYTYNKYYGISVGKDEKPEELTTGGTNNNKATWNTGEFTGRPHYLPYNVYMDEEGNRWIVAVPAGLVATTYDNSYTMDKAPYSYLISFEGIKFSADKSRATNLPTDINVLAKGAFGFQKLVHNISGLTVAQVGDRETTYRGKAYYGLLEYAGIEGRLSFPVLTHETEENSYIFDACFAYTDPADNKQKLMRYLDHPLNDGQRMDYHYMWTYYPSAPSADVIRQYYFDKASPIYLQDIASQDFVTRYAPDWYATRPYKANLWSNTVERTIRKDIDTRAKDVSNYVYNLQSWQQGTFVTSMWNAPVYLMRVTRVYDRGNEEYSTLTEEGLHLRPYKVFMTYYDEEDELDQWMPDPNDILSGDKYSYSRTLAEFFMARVLNGDKSPQPKYTEEKW